jgi:lipopolysaccharide transport system permease protein
MEAGSLRKTVIEPSRGWRMLDARELWSCRELLWVLALRDIKVRYKQTVLGVLWVIIRPLASMVLFTLIFGKLAKIPSDGYPYAVFVFAALIPWTFFSGAVAASGNSLVGYAGLINKIYFPRIIIPIASMGSGLVDLAVSAAFLLAIMPLFGVALSPNLLAFPVLLAAVLLLALGVGTLFSALTATYRDFGGILAFVMQIWMFATPVIYPASLIPESWRWVLHFNPMAALIEGFRSACLGKPFDLPALGVSFAVAAAIFVVGVGYFQKIERRFADII